MFLRFSTRLSVWLLGVALGGGCTHSISRKDVRGPQDLYALALEELESSSPEEAIADFEDLRAKYPYSRFSALAELRIADAESRRGRNVEAIEGYRGFLRLHPSHEQAEYALLKIAEGYRSQLPRQWLLLPPNAERDQASTHEAIAAYDELLSRFPAGFSAAEAHRHRDTCRRRLAEHELYVARFYLREGHPASVCGRALALLEAYGGLGLERPALQLCLEARQRLGDAAGALAIRNRLAALPAG